MYDKGRAKIPHLGNFRPFEWYSQLHPRWQMYILARLFILVALCQRIGTGTKLMEKIKKKKLQSFVIQKKY